MALALFMAGALCSLIGSVRHYRASGRSRLALVAAIGWAVMAIGLLLMVGGE